MTPVERAEQVYGGIDDRCDHTDAGFCRRCHIQRIVAALRDVEQETWKKAAQTMDDLYHTWAERSYPPPSWVAKVGAEFRRRAQEEAG